MDPLKNVGGFAFREARGGRKRAAADDVAPPPSKRASTGRRKSSGTGSSEEASGAAPGHVAVDEAGGTLRAEALSAYTSSASLPADQRIAAVLNAVFTAAEAHAGGTDGGAAAARECASRKECCAKSCPPLNRQDVSCSPRSTRRLPEALDVRDDEGAVKAELCTSRVRAATPARRSTADAAARLCPPLQAASKNPKNVANARAKAEGERRIQECVSAVRLPRLTPRSPWPSPVRPPCRYETELAHWTSLSTKFTTSSSSTPGALSPSAVQDWAASKGKHGSKLMTTVEGATDKALQNVRAASSARLFVRPPAHPPPPPLV